MRRKYNREQKEYIETKKALEALEAREKELEAAFVKSLGVVNEDGTVPSHTWAIDDDSIADQAIDDFGTLVEDCGLWAELCKAKEEFQAAEEKLEIPDQDHRNSYEVRFNALTFAAAPAARKERQWKNGKKPLKRL